jgi:excisionase family DNA binding protein
MKEALTIEQAAEQSGLSVSGLYHLMKTGKLIAIRQDGQTLLSKAALESFLSAVCPICGEPFRKGNQRQRFCSQACRQKANRRKP